MTSASFERTPETLAFHPKSGLWKSAAGFNRHGPEIAADSDRHVEKDCKDRATRANG
jgi:hypothetical protein